MFNLQNCNMWTFKVGKIFFQYSDYNIAGRRSYIWQTTSFHDVCMVTELKGPIRRSSLTRQVASLTRPKAILDESDS